MLPYQQYGNLDEEYTFDDDFGDSQETANRFTSEGVSSTSTSPSESDNEKLFDSIETFLFYLLYQQEGGNRIFESKLNQFLLLIHDTRLKRENFPRNLSVLKKIDKKLMKISENEIKKVY